jgi:plasmid stabilization system protein ParE
MKYRVIVVPKAQAELDHIVAWVAQRSPSGAARLLDRFHLELASLAENAPGFGLAPESELLHREVRQLL